MGMLLQLRDQDRRVGVPAWSGDAKHLSAIQHLKNPDAPSARQPGLDRRGSRGGRAMERLPDNPVNGGSCRRGSGAFVPRLLSMAFSSCMIVSDGAERSAGAAFRIGAGSSEGWRRRFRGCATRCSLPRGLRGALQTLGRPVGGTLSQFDAEQVGDRDRVDSALGRSKSSRRSRQGEPQER